MKRLLKIMIIFAVFWGLTANISAQFPGKIPYNWITFNMDFWGTITLHGGPLIIKETTTPAAAAGFGKIYTKSDDLLYFQDGSGNEQIMTTTLSHLHYAEMYIYNNGGAMTIDEVSTWHGTIGFTEGSSGSHMVYNASIQQAITVWADAGGTPNEVTATSNGIEAAGLLAGDFVTITGTTNYNGVYEILSVTANTFNIEHAWAGNDASGTVTVTNYDNLADLATYIESLSGWTANLLGGASASSADLKNFGSTGVLGIGNELTLIYFNNWMLERIVDRASQIVENYLNFNVVSRTYTHERYDGGGQEVFIRNTPITAISLISSGILSPIRARYTDSTKFNAYIAVTITGINLIVEGVSTALTFVGNNTMALMAAAINGEVSWEAATIDSTYDAYPSSQLFEHPNRYCIGTYIELNMPDEPLDDFQVDMNRGIIFREGGFPEGFQNIFVSYTGGYITVPYAIKGGVCRIAKIMDDRREADETTKSEKLGDYSYTMVDIEKALSPSELIELKGYRNYNIGGGG